MNEIDIRKYAKLMEELGLTGLEITEDNKVVRMERGNAGVSEMQPHQPSLALAANHKDSVTEISGNNHDYVTIKSPMVGVFYAAPAENAAPFVTIGDRVEKGKTLCIIEAMKLMNEIHAEESGEIVEICVTNGQMVEYGTELFKIRR